MPESPNGDQSDQKPWKLLTENHCAAFLCAAILLGYAVYGFSMRTLVVPLSSGTMTLTGAAALWASTGAVLLCLGIGSIPFWTRGPKYVRILGTLGISAGGIFDWIATLVQ